MDPNLSMNINSLVVLREDQVESNELELGPLIDVGHVAYEVKALRNCNLIECDNVHVIQEDVQWNQPVAEGNESEGTEVVIEDSSVGVVDSPVTQLFLLDDGSIKCIQNSVIVVNGVKNREDEVEVETAVEGDGELIKAYRCSHPGCDRVYLHLCLLRVHESSHSVAKPYTCTHDGCGKSFKSEYCRKIHERVHTGEKPHACPHQGCGKSFKTSGDLWKHTRTHTGERPFMCPIEGCNKTFTNSNICKNHIRTHTGERPFVCEYEGCTRSFATSTNFKNHMRIHSGEKPFCCSFVNCQRRFTEYSSLYKHNLVHYQSKKYQCNFCQKTYRHTSSLTTHKRTAHGVISMGNGTEVSLDQMMGRGKNGVKNMKNFTSSLLDFNRINSITYDESASSLYIVSRKAKEPQQQTGNDEEGEKADGEFEEVVQFESSVS